MKTVKANKGTPYEAKRHFHMWGLKKVDRETAASRLTVSISHFLPNGGAEMSSSAKERVYYLLSGALTVAGPEEEHLLEEGDLLYIAPGEERAIKVRGVNPATVLVIIVEP
ncbi:MAG: cupin domain-containing protein [Firmicutes bacterium]|nr:cupin domain-containing protein [Bacillota bacterium]